MNQRKWAGGLLALTLLFGMTLAACDTPTGDTGSPGTPKDDPGGDFPAITEPVTGRATITYTNVPVEGADGITRSEVTTGDGITFSMSGGKMNMSFPQNPSRGGGSSSLIEHLGLLLNMTITPPLTEIENIVYLPDIFSEYRGSFRLARRWSEGALPNDYKWSQISYIYVSTNVTFNRAAATTETQQSHDGLSILSTYSALNLALKTGWNLVRVDYTFNSSTNTDTYTVKIADKDIPWKRDSTNGTGVTAGGGGGTSAD